ncbi:MAG: tetratricopeptide repeat protein, partial [Chitinophagaceae bacterium]
MRSTILVLISFFSAAILFSSCQNNGTELENSSVKPDSFSNPIAKMEKSIKAYPDSLLLIAKLSDLQEANGQLDLAYATIEKGLQKDSTSVIFHNRRASLLL